jgi:tetratricopeptide (TPR) repeat protein
VETLIDACGRLPLALAVTAARAATSPVRTLRQLAAELGASQTRLNALRVGDAATDVRSVFSWSYRLLPPEAARLFRLLGSHPGRSITAPAAASLAGLPEAAVQPLLADLVEAHLATEPTTGRYGMHDLMRVYAAETSPAETDEAVARMLDHYAHSALRASARLDQHQLLLTPDQPLAGVAPESFDDWDRAESWFWAEYETLLAGFWYAVEHELDPQVWLLAAGMSTFVDWNGRWHDWIRLTTAGLTAAQRSGGAREQAHMLRRRGMANHRLGRPAAAYQDLESAQRLCATYHDGRELCRIHVNLGIVRGGEGRMSEAFEHAQVAYRYAVEADTGLASRANILNGMAWCLIQLGEPHQAEAYCRQALSMFAEVNDRHGEAEAWDTYGLVHHRLGDHARSVDSYRHALALFRDVRAQLPQADTLHHLGDAHHAQGQSAPAREAWQAALVILDELDHPDAGRIRSKIAEVSGPGLAPGDSPRPDPPSPTPGSNP